ncbi:adenylate kinase [Rhizobium straminoryzae]|uniref:Adenylate kinase n=1 Tax=Rhizobium straminoryzae TaxID=1387186 RepID=A0A549SZT6_9HYPH|nr:AAA family ATPase [Rhizobium straminoryzae]TRL35126.1 adenylate kinase [Rhizobium straminoryzae]
MARIHIMGASGSGTTTLGRMLGERLRIPHLDTDSFFWMPTEPPFTTPRPVPERLQLIEQAIAGVPSWVLSGSALKWGTPLEPLYDLIVFLRLDPEVRMARIRRRESERYGDRILPGGDMAETSRAFLEWAASYDTAGPEQRSLAAHEAWLAGRETPVLRLDSMLPAEELAEVVLRHPVIGQAS